MKPQSLLNLNLSRHELPRSSALLIQRFNLNKLRLVRLFFQKLTAFLHAITTQIQYDLLRLGDEFPIRAAYSFVLKLHFIWLVGFGEFAGRLQIPILGD